MKRIMILFFLIFSFKSALVAQYLVIPKSSEYAIYNRVLQGKNCSYKALSLNCISEDRGFRKFIIHAMVFSDSTGFFNKKEIKIENGNNNFIKLDSLFSIAKVNLLQDHQREISTFEYESDYEIFPIRVKSYKVAIQLNDSIYSVYENLTHCFFYESRPYKQFTIVQSCASLINIQSIQLVMPRVNEKGSMVASIPNQWDKPPFYFSNKLFLERINKDKTYHFVKFKTECRDCIDNNNSEFDYDDKLGIVRLWCYLPNQIINKRFYVEFQ